MKPLPRIVAFVGSPRFATVLLALLGVWTVAAAVMRLERSFTSPPFVAAVFVLALSTGICAWRRSGVALRRTRALRAATTGAELGRNRTEIPCDPALSSDAILAASRDVLARVNIAAGVEEDRLVAASPVWSVWGSPLFHWALVALIVLVPLGGLFRSSGQMGIAVGQSKPDLPGSYGLLTAGPLKGWDRGRTIRVDDFEVNYSYRGVDRGPTPTVSVLGEDGSVITSQRVYPNHTLETGSLAIYPADYGLAADVSLLRGSSELSRSTELLDFSGKAEDGTVPLSPMVVARDDGTQFTVAVSVPLDRTDTGYLGRLPKVRQARVLVTSAEGQTVLDEMLLPGETVPLPTGDLLRLNGLGYYARLQIVEDPSAPLLYLAVALAILGLGVATFARQMIVVAQVVETEDGRRLDVTIDLWRDLTTSAEKITADLERAVAAGGKEAHL